MMEKIGDWIFDHLGLLIVAIIATIIVLLVFDYQSMGKECDNMMQMARTSRDSLDARIACNRMKSDAATAFAIGAAAGAVAGSAGSRR